MYICGVKCKNMASKRTEIRIINPEKQLLISLRERAVMNKRTLGKEAEWIIKEYIQSLTSKKEN